MDRAHRIGQTKTVNVYRLILKDTVEEKIMNLQRFKQNLAKSLVQARKGTDGDQNKLLDQEDTGKLELDDLLKSFEEHSTCQDVTLGKRSATQKKN